MQDKYEAAASPLGVIFVADIQSIQQSNALGFGANTSLSIRTHSRTLEVGDQKELVADALLFVLMRWISIRSTRNDPILAPSLSIPIIEMPHILQKEAVRYIEKLSTENYPDLMQEPPFFYSWTPEAQNELKNEYLSLFTTVFDADPLKADSYLLRYLLLHGTWTNEIVIIKTNDGKIRRTIHDPEPILHFISDHFASITRMDLSSFQFSIDQITPIAKRLKTLYEDYKYALPLLVIPTFEADPSKVTDIIELFKDGMPGIQFSTPNATTSCKVLLEDGTYLLQLYSNQPVSPPLYALVDHLTSSSPGPRSTTDGPLIPLRLTSSDNLPALVSSGSDQHLASNPLESHSTTTSESKFTITASNAQGQITKSMSNLALAPEAPAELPPPPVIEYQPEIQLI